MKGQVPAGLGPGAHELVVTTAAGSSSKPGAFRVKEGKVESQGTPCAGEFTAFTKLAQKQKKFVMDRHYKKPEGKREVVEVPEEEVRLLRPSPTSRMPSGMLDGLTAREILEMLAWLLEER